MLLLDQWFQVNAPAKAETYTYPIGMDYVYKAYATVDQGQSDNFEVGGVFSVTATNCHCTTFSTPINVWGVETTVLWTDNQPPCQILVIGKKS